MKTHYIEKETKDIVKAIIHAEKKRKRQKKNQSQFDKVSSEAIAAAKKEMIEALSEEIDKGTSTELVEYIYESLIYNTPYEAIFNMCVCRRLFYEYRTEFCYLVAVNMKIINRSEKEGR